MEWTLDAFIAQFESNITPEILTNILVETLYALEAQHRRGAVYGVLEPADILIRSDGGIRLGPSPGKLRADHRFEAPELLKGEQLPTIATDVYSIQALFQSYMPAGPREHPKLKRLLTTRFDNAWDLRAALLDLLFEIGVEGEPFLVVHFIRDPVGYNRALRVVVGERTKRRTRQLIHRGRRRAALKELEYLLELAPANREAVRLMRTVKQGIQRVTARIAYVAVLLAILLISASVVVQKLNLPIGSGFVGQQPLLIEPVLTPAARSPVRGPGSQPAQQLSIEAASGMIELSQHVTPFRPGSREPAAIAGHSGKFGTVRLDLDPDARAYFDGAPGKVQAYRHGALLWLREGQHTVTVTKPERPSAMAAITVRPGSEILLSGRVVLR